MKKPILLMLAMFLLILTACGQAADTPQSTPTVPVATTLPVDSGQSVPEEAGNPVPKYLSQEPDTAVYSFPLTREQAQNYAKGYFTLFRECGDNRYVPFYFSTNVTLEGTTLKANYNGKIPYVLDDFNRCCLSSIMERETRDGKTHFTMDLQAGDYLTAEDGTSRFSPQRYQIHGVFDRKTGELLTSQILPENQAPAEDIFLQAQPRLQLPTASHYILDLYTAYMPLRNAEGVILPCIRWETSVFGTGTCSSWPASCGLQLAYGRLSEVTAPFTTGNVYMVFLVRDQDGNEYGSELIPVSVEKIPDFAMPVLPAAETAWSTGNRILLAEDQGVSVYLCKNTHYGTIVHDLQIYNSTTIPVELQISNPTYNSQLTLDDRSICAEPGQWGGYAPFTIPDNATTADTGPLESFTCNLKLYDDRREILWLEQNVQVDLSGSAVLRPGSPNTE